MKSVKVDKQTVQVGESVKLSLEVIDNLSEVTTVQVNYRKPMSNNSQALFLEYNSQTGLYESIITVDELMEAGKWQIDFIFVCDSKDNCGWVNNTNINPNEEGKDLSQGDFTIKLINKQGWVKEGTTWYYFKSNGSLATGWEKVDGTWYFFNQFGEMKTGWLQEGSTWYYLKSSGAMATGWEKVDGTWYFFNQSGSMKTGWLQEGSTWYYLKSSGAMATGWEKVNGTWYFFNQSGSMKTGWLQEGSTWYYLKSSGAMATGWEKVNGTWYYFYGSGKMATNTVIDGWKITSNGAAYKL